MYPKLMLSSSGICGRVAYFEVEAAKKANSAESRKGQQPEKTLWNIRKQGFSALTHVNE